MGTEKEGQEGNKNRKRNKEGHESKMQKVRTEIKLKVMEWRTKKK